MPSGHPLSTKILGDDGRCVFSNRHEIRSLFGRTSAISGRSKPLWIGLVAKQLWVRRRHSGRRFDCLAVQIRSPNAPSIRCFRHHANALRLTRDSHRYLQTGNRFCQVSRVLRRYGEG
jgi:hypothetical protein